MPFQRKNIDFWTFYRSIISLGHIQKNAMGLKKDGSPYYLGKNDIWGKYGLDQGSEAVARSVRAEPQPK